MPATTIRCAALAGAFAVALLAAPVDVPGAQLPAPFQLPKSAAPAPPKSTPAPPDGAAKLAELRARLKRLEAPDTATEGSPPNTPDSEIADRIRLLRQTERSLAQRIDGEERRAALVRARRDA
ncbi:MAG: hypothetical protein ABI812_08015, partial [Betaproteobacteria bacterium]